MEFCYSGKSLETCYANVKLEEHFILTENRKSHVKAKYTIVSRSGYSI